MYRYLQLPEESRNQAKYWHQHRKVDANALTPGCCELLDNRMPGILMFAFLMMPVFLGYTEHCLQVTEAQDLLSSQRLIIYMPWAKV